MSAAVAALNPPQPLPGAFTWAAANPKVFPTDAVNQLRTRANGGSQHFLVRTQLC
jgi:hypothetical protein